MNERMQALIREAERKAEAARLDKLERMSRIPTATDKSRRVVVKGRAS